MELKFKDTDEVKYLISCIEKEIKTLKHQINKSKSEENKDYKTYKTERLENIKFRLKKLIN